MDKSKSIKQSSPKQRVREFLGNLNIKHSDAEKLCGFSRGYLGSGGEITTDKLRALKKQFPHINIEYIVTGELMSSYIFEKNEDQIMLLKQINRMLEKLKEKNISLINSLSQENNQYKN